MKELDELFREEKIEYYAVLDYKAVTETNPDILKRNGDITPRSIIVFLLPYYCGETVNLSRYSASLDYHILIRRMTDRVIGLLSELDGDRLDNVRAALRDEYELLTVPADRYFPNLDALPNWHITETSEILEENGIQFRYVDYQNDAPLSL